METLFKTDTHHSILYHDLSEGHMVQANQHLIIDNGEGFLLDPGGHKVYSALFGQISEFLPISGLKHILLSHQDPDILAATNGWLMVTDARAHLSALWMRFITHFGVDALAVTRIDEIPDEGKIIKTGLCEFKIIPAHFLHSSGNFQVYDPCSKILYSGDLGASLGVDYTTVNNFDDHIQYMEWFHKRFMPSSKALKMWAKMARKLDIDMIAPQHGAMIAGKENVLRFIDWIDSLDCGAALMNSFIIP
jgi:flavorubredoxin